MRFIFALFVLTSFSLGPLVACKVGRRGKCTSTSDCADGLTCLRSRCRDRAFFNTDIACKKSTDCVDEGACGAGWVKKAIFFDGVDCIAVDEADCRAAKCCRQRGECTLKDRGCWATMDQDCRAAPICTKQGRCVAQDGRCRAMNDADCLASSECKTDHKCRAVEQKCRLGPPTSPANARCTPLPKTAAPAWAVKAGDEIPSLPVRQLDRDWPPSQPGDLEHATLACLLQVADTWKDDHPDFTLKISVGSYCQTSLRGPEDSFEATVALSDISLKSHQAVRIEAIDRDFLSDDYIGFGNLTYSGRSPFKIVRPPLTTTCHVLSRANAGKRAAEPLATAAKIIKREKNRKPRPQYSDFGLFRMDFRDVRYHLTTAAAWVGWDHPQVQAAVAALARSEEGWRQRVVAMFERMRAKLPPAGEQRRTAGGVLHHDRFGIWDHSRQDNGADTDNACKGDSHRISPHHHTSPPPRFAYAETHSPRLTVLPHL